MAELNSWVFFKDNKKNRAYSLSLEELKIKYLDWLKTKDKSWLEYYGYNIQSMYIFIGDSEESKGLNSTSVMEDGEEQWKSLRVVRVDYFNDLKIK